MEKLTLEHLAGYLPYKLNCVAICDLEMQTDYDSFEIVDEKGIIIVLDFIYNEMCGYSVSRDEYYKYSNHFNKDVFNSIKPILRPLSDLTKEIEHNGEKFVPIEAIYDLMGWEKEELIELIDRGDIIGIYSDEDLIPFSHAIKLQSWHFDIHGLIDKNLAIDINTI